jgi:hypothetical protein
MKQMVSPVLPSGRRAVQVRVDLSHVELLYRELAARVAVEDAELELGDVGLESLGATVLGLADEGSKDAISAAIEGGGVSVGASLPPAPDATLGSATHEWADLLPAYFTLDGESLIDTLHALRESIAAEDPVYLTTVSLQRIDELNRTEGILLIGDLLPHEPNPGFSFHRVGAPVKPWLEGHFVTIYADNMLASDADGGQPRRVCWRATPRRSGRKGSGDHPGNKNRNASHGQWGPTY